MRARPRLATRAQQPAIRSSFELRPLGRTRTRPQRLVVGAEERLDCRMKAALLLITAGVRCEPIHAHTRIAREVAARLFASQIVFARVRDEASLGEHHEERQAVMRRYAHQAVHNLVLHWGKVVNATQREVKGRCRMWRLAQSESWYLTRTACTLFKPRASFQQNRRCELAQVFRPREPLIRWGLRGHEVQARLRYRVRYAVEHLLDATRAPDWVLWLSAADQWDPQRVKFNERAARPAPARTAETQSVVAYVDVEADIGRTVERK